MAAAEMTETVYNVSPNLGGKIMKFKYTAVTNGDWLIFPDPIGAVFATDGTGAQMTTLYAVSDAASEVASATATALTGATFTVEQRPDAGYVLVDNEIMEYSGATQATATGDLTLEARGCFGTTAASHTSGVAYVLNTVVFSTATGLIRGMADVIEE